ncbi:hypothetical protein F5Y16DRAFT_424247 [Xylariaceae sp. FL0255]|nr:hypothetical protein F5Y16DRAFT_424247 [Xylariaceae sp. FL0255]
MFSTKTIVLFIAATAAPLVRADYWAMFCDDTDCTTGCGESVSVTNPGCLNESGRQSILFHGDIDSGDYSLVVSPSGNCPCQDNCETIPSGTTCLDISLYEDAQSFRFISGNCGSNNC